MSEFVEFAKMGRLSRECVITEKIDGTNAQIFITEAEPEHPLALAYSPDFTLMLMAGSRTRYLTPQNDNFGFAKWAQGHAPILFGLGEGRHFGEWWGSGVQRGYGLTEKRFSLFNVARWHEAGREPYVSVSADPRQPAKESIEAPVCCHVVPVLYRCEFDTADISRCLDFLRTDGSVAAPGFMKPEGVVIFHTATGTMFKKTLEKDEEPKSKVSARDPRAGGAVARAVQPA